MPDDYTLPRYKSESTRLDLQHDAYVKTVGYLLHPRIASTLPRDAKIADVGTGTGVWLRELATTCPDTWSLHGLDISDTQFPKPDAADHQRIKYDVLSINDDPPTEFEGQFDVVHMRLLILALEDHQWTIVAKNALRLLKPGGWIQWHESQFHDFRVYQAESGTSIEANRRILAAVVSTLEKQGKFSWHVEHLQVIVQGAGFEDVAVDLFSSDRFPDARKQFEEVEVRAMRLICTVLAENDPAFPLSMEEVDGEVAKAAEELADGKAYHQWPMRIVTARKSNP